MINKLGIFKTLEALDKFLEPSILDRVNMALKNSDEKNKQTERVKNFSIIYNMDNKAELTNIFSVDMIKSFAEKLTHLGIRDLNEMFGLDNNFIKNVAEIINSFNNDESIKFLLENPKLFLQICISRIDSDSNIIINFFNTLGEQGIKKIGECRYICGFEKTLKIITDNIDNPEKVKDCFNEAIRTEPGQSW